jgi:hypothetical protein
MTAERERHKPLREVGERIYRFVGEFPDQAKKVDRSLRKFSQEVGVRMILRMEAMSSQGNQYGVVAELEPRLGPGAAFGQGSHPVRPVEELWHTYT